MKYFVIFLVLIGFVGIAFGQYVGDKLPPGTMIPDYEGDYIFPPDYVDFYYSDSHFEKYSVTDQQYRYDIPYMISNGTISNMSINCSDVELVLSIEPSGNKGWVTLALPRVLVDSKIDISQDDDFFVLLDSKEVSHSDIPAEKLRILIIPFYHDTSQVNVIGVNYPEHAGGNACNGKHEPPFSYLLSPLKQYKTGILLNEIQCKQNLVLIQKYDGSPACVTESTKQKLIERGWTSSSVIVTIYSNFEQNRDRTYTNPRNVIIDLEKDNSIKWLNNAGYAVQVYDYENKSWSTGQIYPAMSDSIQFNNTGYYEFAVESAHDRHFGNVVVISENTNSLPLETRIMMGMAIVSNDLGKNSVLIGVGIGDTNEGVKIDINQKELEQRDDAESFYYNLYNVMIPFDVPITIDFREPFRLLE